jgi:hypothetical protein
MHALVIGLFINRYEFGLLRTYAEIPQTYLKSELTGSPPNK